MKLLIVAVALSIAYVSAQDSYTTKYDGLDLDQMLANKRLITAYIKCILDVGKCTPEGKELKSHITEALQNGCARCTDAQRKGMRKVIRHMLNNEPESWKQLVQKYDPKGVYSTKYEKELKSL